MIVHGFLRREVARSAEKIQYTAVFRFPLPPYMCETIYMSRTHVVARTNSRLDTVVRRKRGNVKFRHRFRKPAIGNGRLL